MRAVPAALAAAGVLAQVAYPLLDGPALRAATVAAVLLLYASALTHAALHRGPGWALRLAVVAGGTALVAEAVGVATGFPFGGYAYAGTLGPQVLGVPVLVPAAWTMTAYPCLLLGRRLAGGRGRLVPLLGGLPLAAWDLYLDPQMVAAGHWRWSDPEPALPGVPGIPLTNYAGWVLVAVVMVALLHAALPAGRGGRAARTPAAEAVPAAVLTWTWAGSALANAAFFGRPAVAGYGAVAMGVFVVPYLRRLAADARRRPAPQRST